MDSTSKNVLRMSKKEWGDEKQYAAKMFALAKRQLCELFINAVENHDGQRIIELAEAVWFFKGKSKPADPTRHALLGFKYSMGIMGQKSQPIGKIVADLKSQGIAVGSPEDGYSKIRKICKELGIAITPSRKTGKK